MLLLLLSGLSEMNPECHLERAPQRKELQEMHNKNLPSAFYPDRHTLFVYACRSHAIGYCCDLTMELLRALENPEIKTYSVSSVGFCHALTFFNTISLYILNSHPCPKLSSQKLIT